MGKLIDKDKVVAEIERIKKEECPIDTYEGRIKLFYFERFLSFINTLEVKDANEALRTEYEKGRADVIADTLSWLENCWSKYCSNQTIIEGFKEAIKGE